LLTVNPLSRERPSSGSQKPGLELRNVRRTDCPAVFANSFEADIVVLLQELGVDERLLSETKRALIGDALSLGAVQPGPRALSRLPADGLNAWDYSSAARIVLSFSRSIRVTLCLER
jgi:hypothetical protein